MVRVAGSPSRLRPHVKTHKCREIIALQQAVGIDKFKCATIAEAQMLGDCQARDVLLAYQPVGPNIRRLNELMVRYPEVQFSALVDNSETAGELENFAREKGSSFHLFIDIDVGTHRTGIPAGAKAKSLKDRIDQSNTLLFRGLHVYDGHIRDSDLDIRTQQVASAFLPVSEMIESESIGEVVAGGSPTFPVHARNPQVDLSPGTCLLWDHGYSSKLPDQNFKHAAVLLTRVISKPGDDVLCLDLGHKSVASEMPHPRVHFPDLNQVAYLNHNEEHLVIKTPDASNLKVGEALYGIPEHICPTTALHQELMVVVDGQVQEKWKVYARDRDLGV